MSPSTIAFANVFTIKWQKPSTRAMKRTQSWLKITVSPRQLWMNQTTPATLQPPKHHQNAHSKPCTLCQRPRDVPIRCQIYDTKKCYFICTGKCWQEVSIGKTDAYGGGHPLYRYGGMWMNKHDAMSAKIKGKAKEENKNRWVGGEGPHRRKAWKPHLGKKCWECQDWGWWSDIEVSELDDDEYEGKLFDRFEQKEIEGNEDTKVSSQGLSLDVARSTFVSLFAYSMIN